MATKLTLLDVDPGNTLEWCRASIGLSGNYAQFTYANNTVAAGGGGGEVMDFTTLAGQVGFFGQAMSAANPAPNAASPGPTVQQAFVYSAAGNIANQYAAVTAYQNGQNPQFHAANNVPLVITNAAGTQQGAGAYAAPLTTDVIEVQYAVRKMQ